MKRACGIASLFVASVASAEPATLVRWDTSPALRDMPVRPSRPHGERERERRPPMFRPATPAFVDRVAQTIATAAMPAPAQSFDGMGTGFVGPAGPYQFGGVPPDTNGDVGRDHYVETVNVSMTVFSKTGMPVYGPVDLATLWTGFGGNCENNSDGDPLVKYDRMADRWVVSQMMVSKSPNLECVAVSATSDPMGEWHRYAFSYTGNIDYPKMGVWPDAYYFTQNLDSGANVCAFERAAMLTGAMARSQCFATSAFGLMPASHAGGPPPDTTAPEYVVALDTDALSLWKLHVDFATPANSTFTATSLPVMAYSQPSSIKQPGTTTTLDAISEQLMYGLEYRRFADHEALVVNHTVGSSGHVGVRWYEVRDPGGTATIFQQGTYIPDGSERWMGSINIDSAGDIALGFTAVGTALKPSVHYTGRVASDPPGMMQGEGTIQDGGGVVIDNSNPARWGDYSSLSVDPSDDCTFWYVGEYQQTNGLDWNTRIASFKFDGCQAAAPDAPAMGGDDPAQMGGGGGGCGCSHGRPDASIALAGVVLLLGWRRRR